MVAGWVPSEGFWSHRRVAAAGFPGSRPVAQEFFSAVMVRRYLGGAPSYSMGESIGETLVQYRSELAMVLAA